MNIAKHNQAAWDHYVEKKDQWTVPVSSGEIEKARKGDWAIVLTPKKPVPHNWFPALKGTKVLGLASGGGQQGPILAALGSEVTIFDNSQKQLQQDEKVARDHKLILKTVRGDMRDLSVFENNSFDVIFNPCSVLFVDDLQKVWKECFRVLKPGGILMTGLMNPLAFQIDDKELHLKYKKPYSDLHSLPKEDLEDLKNKNEALCYGHSLSDQLGGQLAAGFVITHMFEDDWGGDELIDEYFPSFIATRAIKPEN